MEITFQRRSHWGFEKYQLENGDLKTKKLFFLLALFYFYSLWSSSHQKVNLPCLVLMIVIGNNEGILNQNDYHNNNIAHIYVSTVDLQGSTIFYLSPA